MDKQVLTCRETTHSSSVDSLAFHVAIIFMVCGISYVAVGFLKAHHIPLLSNIAEWAYAIAMFGQSTGVIMTGILLLRICDSDMETPVLKDFSISYALSTLLCYAMRLPVIKLLPNSGSLEINRIKTLNGKEFTLLNLPFYLAGSIPEYLEWMISQDKEGRRQPSSPRIS